MSTHNSFTSAYAQGRLDLVVAEPETELVKRFFALTRRLTDPAKAAALGGDVSVSTIRRWKAEVQTGGVRPLSATSRAALDDYLLGAAITKGGQGAARAVIQEMRDKLDELEERVTPPAPLTVAEKAAAKAARGLHPPPKRPSPPREKPGGGEVTG